MYDHICPLCSQPVCTYTGSRPFTERSIPVMSDTTARCDDCDWTTEVTPDTDAATLARLHVGSGTHEARASATVDMPCDAHGTVHKVKVSGGG